MNTIKKYLIISIGSILSFFLTFSSPSELFSFPISNSYISSYFGYRELFGKQNFHNGIDIPANPGTPIYATYSGYVKQVSFDRFGYGNYIVLIHGNGYKSIYGHLEENIRIQPGDQVRKGEMIGRVGPKTLTNGMLNGSTTGPHLHFTVYGKDGKPLDPFSLSFE